MSSLSADPQSITVDLGQRSYKIEIGDELLPQIGGRIAELHPGSRVVIVTDETVNGLHGDTVRHSLADADIASATVVVAAGEKSKSFADLEFVVDEILAAGMERGDVLVALGGGVVGDLAGFAAGITRRGMNFVQAPTSLLAQVDSSVGGKTGINTARGKNLVGLFNQPSLVVADTSVLNTLSDREMRAGYAEVAKYGLIDRPEFFEWLEANHAQVFAGGPARAHAVALSCQAKADVVKADEFEMGSRALLNLGHTFGHALEASVGYDSQRLVHGEGVAIGMVLAHEFSARMNHCGPEAAERVVAHLKAVGLPTTIDEIPGEPLQLQQLLSAIAQDKKVQRGALTFILTRGIGQSFVAKDVPASEVEAFLQLKLAA
ncbi:MAG: 3-dehydroquinate synthase [Rhizobiaceae bacterium]|nr:3-dehydroquinate synthase [Rhizobiaceae bacterium]